MSYLRVIPRDLFNEANLLKCLGQLYLELERVNIPNAKLVHDHESFDVGQDSNDGSISAHNVILVTNGVPYFLWRPLNSREPWPLYIKEVGNGNEISVFNQSGALSDHMHKFLKGIE